MKIVVSQSELAFALKELKKVTGNRPSHADFGDVKVIPSAGAIHLHALDGQQECLVSIPASVEDFTSPFYINIFSFIDNISPIDKTEPIQITDKGNSVIILGGNSGIKFSLPIKLKSEVRDGTELFPKKEEKTFKIQSDILWLAINSTAFAASTDPAKQVLTGVNFSIDGNKLSVAATNGHILPAISIEDAVEFSGSELSFTFPFKILKEIGKILKKKDISPLTAVTVSNNYIEVGFTCGHVKFNYRVPQVPGTYPNYTQLFPDTFRFESTLKVREFSKSSEGAHKVAKGWNNVVKLCFEDFGVSLFADDGVKDGVTFNQRIGANYSHKDGKETFTIAFNSSYIIDGLKALPFNQSEVTMMANSPTTPAVLQPAQLPDGIKYRYLVMPVQIRS